LPQVISRRRCLFRAGVNSQKNEIPKSEKDAEASHQSRM
jgi:hypothetical protein